MNMLFLSDQCGRDFFYQKFAEEKQPEHNIEYKRFYHLVIHIMNLNGMKFGVPGIFFTLILSYSSFLTQHSLVRPFYPVTYHVLLRVTLVCQHVLVTVSVSPHNTTLFHLFPLYFASLRVSWPRLNFTTQYQPMVSGSKLSLVEIGGDFSCKTTVDPCWPSSYLWLAQAAVTAVQKRSPRESYLETESSSSSPDVPEFPSVDTILILLGIFQKNTCSCENFMICHFWCPPHFHLLVCWHGILAKSK